MGLYGVVQLNPVQASVARCNTEEGGVVWRLLVWFDGTALLGVIMLSTAKHAAVRRVPASSDEVQRITAQYGAL